MTLVLKWLKFKTDWLENILYVLVVFGNFPASCTLKLVFFP